MSVVIPSYNRRDALIKTLQGLAGQTLPMDNFEVIVVDDGSTDETQSAIREINLPYSFKFVEQNNLGPGATRNRGASLAKYDFLVFLDADMIPAPILLEQYLEARKDSPKTIFIGRQLPWPEAFLSPFEQVFNYVSFSDPGSNLLQPPFYYFASGNFAMECTQLWDLNGFDEALRMTEDTDLAYRAYLAGIPIAYLPSAVGYHNHSKTLRQLCQQTESSAWWTAQLMKKHPEMRGQIPVYQDLEPVALGKDSIGLILRKAVQRSSSTRFLFALLRVTIRFFELNSFSPRLLHFLYRKQIARFRLIGLRRGLQEYLPPMEAVLESSEPFH